MGLPWLVLLFSIPDLLAAYRAYYLRIEYYTQKGTKIKTEWVTSTIDPYQYQSYHGTYPWLRVVLEDTWFCPGDTGRRRKICPRPIGSSPADRKAVAGSHNELPYNRQPIIPGR